MGKDKKEIHIIYTVNIPNDFSEQDLNLIKNNAVDNDYEVLPTDEKSLNIRLKPSEKFQEAIRNKSDFALAQTGGLKDVEDNLGITTSQAQYRIEKN